MLVNLLILALGATILSGLVAIERYWINRLLAAQRRRIVIHMTELLMPFMLEQGGRASPLFQRLIETADMSDEQ